jgi:DNA mismatch repair protein MutH
MALAMRGPRIRKLTVVAAPLNQVSRVDYEAEHVRWYQRPLLWSDVDGQNANRDTI